MNSERKTLIKIALFIFASALVGGYLKERVRWKYNPNSPRPDLETLAIQVFQGAFEYCEKPKGRSNYGYSARPCIRNKGAPASGEPSAKNRPRSRPHGILVVEADRVPNAPGIPGANDSIYS
jgi:hypothetical protein